MKPNHSEPLPRPTCSAICTPGGNPVWTWYQVLNAVNATCSCGGNPPTKCCQACEVYHRLMGNWPNEKLRESAQKTNDDEKQKKTKRTAKARADSLQRLVSRCSEERILQLSNDVSEGIGSGNVREWRAVALYFRNLFDKQHQSIGALRMSLAALTIAEEMRTHAVREIAAWVKAANAALSEVADKRRSD